MQTQISKWGNSLAVRIPKAHAEQLGLLDGMTVELEAAGDAITITKTKYDLGAMLNAITPENLHGETGWGAPVGREEW
ncbi:MAG: AbrB/MazE/SpoVT family DNA-binding domain-containing protein [Hyphomicrobiales bacterium]|mgnify:CR=1 FL=1|nr:AbrB/MazE/SpoVT family DNA-binding domain-containing protein [Hyphomicrobiales bacterium]